MSSINLSNTCNKNQHWEKGRFSIWFPISLSLWNREREGVRRTSNQEINSLSIIDPIQKLTYPSRDRGKSGWVQLKSS
jgi:hypothetical protein